MKTYNIKRQKAITIIKSKIDHCSNNEIEDILNITKMVDEKLKIKQLHRKLQKVKNENTELKKSAHDLNLIRWLLKLDWPNLKSMSLVPFYDKELAKTKWINLETKQLKL